MSHPENETELGFLTQGRNTRKADTVIYLNAKVFLDGFTVNTALFTLQTFSVFSI
jgi:hypothetical protein